MKKLLIDNKSPLFFIFTLLILWRLFLFIPAIIAPFLIQQRLGFIGSSPWANFDGIHYLSIAQNGYFQFEQAFFPVFPLLIRMISFVVWGNYLIAGIVIVYSALFLFLLLFYKLLLIDFNEKTVRWILLFTLFFPTAFFFGAIYTESFFLLLVISSFYFARKKRWLLAGMFAGIASGTKLIGIFLLPALLFELYTVYKKKLFTKKHILSLGIVGITSISGVAFYMFYLWRVYGDPLLFIHAQPAFGANRTGGTIILLPQVLFRYIKIFMTVPFSHYDFWIALLEFSLLFLGLFLLFWGLLQKKIRISYLLFALLAIIGPTLTGSLSSIPRYVLAAFPLYIFLGMIKSTRIKIILLIVCSIFLIVLTGYFLQGYFIS